MIDLGSVFRDDAIIAVTRPQTTWRLSEAAPDVMAALGEAEPLVPEVCRRMCDELPIQRQWGFGESGVFVRPDRHARAIYVDLARVDPDRGRGSIAIKGGEAMCENFDDMVRRLAGMWNLYSWTFGGPARTLFRDPGMVSALERFPVIEGKPPGVHAHWDAQEEADCALELQRAHLARHGTLARTPVPLLVARWPDSTSRSILDALTPHLSPKAIRTVEAEISLGLGVYVYYYPCIPLRVMHIQAPAATGAETMEQRLRQLSQVCSVDQTIDRWVELVSRVLALGYVATDPANLNRGYCVQPQNMVIDGGFVDVNSLRAIDTFKAEGEFAFALMRTVQQLAHSITWFLIGADAGSETLAQALPDVYAEVRADIQRRLARAESELHPWLAAAMATGDLPQVLRRTVHQLIALGDYRPGEREASSYRIP